MKLIRTLALIAPLVLLACNREDAQSTADQVVETSETPVTSSSSEAVVQLNELYEEYFERNLELNPLRATFIGDNRWNDRFPNTLGPQHRAAQKALWEEYLDRVDAFDASKLAGQDLLNYEMFTYNLKINLEGQEIPTYLMPINQFRNPANFFVQMGSGSSVQPFNTVQDYDNFLSRMDGFVIMMEQARTNMREGIEKGYVQPRILMEKVIPQLESQLVENVEKVLSTVRSGTCRNPSVPRIAPV